jgi:RND superfamily putative drug exporter
VRLVSAVASAPRVSPAGREHPEAVGPVGRLGRSTVDHGRVVAIAWVIVAIGLGFFAPKVESALSGAG